MKSQVLRFQYIDGVRGILALWVLFGHVLTAVGLGRDWPMPFRIFADGVNAVDIFVIISGFVIIHLLETGQEDYRTFIFRRLLRIYPIYFICLTASCLLLGLEIKVNSQAPWPTAAHQTIVLIATDSITWLPYHLAAHVTLLHSVIPDSLLMYSDYAILGQAWSLSLEWQFYLLAPLILFCLKKNTPTAVILILAMAVVNGCITGVQGFLPRHIPYFALGIFSYYLLTKRWRSDWALLMPVGAVLTFLCSHDVAMVIWSVIILSCLQPDSIAHRTMTNILESQPLLWLGKISYSIYLSHSIIITLNMELLHYLGLESSGQSAFFAIALTLTIGETLIVSSLLYRFVEAPAIAFGKVICHHVGPKI